MVILKRYRWQLIFGKDIDKNVDANQSCYDCISGRALILDMLQKLPASTDNSVPVFSCGPWPKTTLPRSNKHALQTLHSSACVCASINFTFIFTSTGSGNIIISILIIDLTILAIDIVIVIVIVIIIIIILIIIMMIMTSYIRSRLQIFFAKKQVKLVGGITGRCTLIHQSKGNAFATLREEGTIGIRTIYSLEV